MRNDQIAAVLQSVRDDVKDLEKCVNLLYDLQQDKGPVIEVVTILKYEKPSLHALLKKRFVNNPGMRMLFDLTMNYEQCKQKLGM